VKARSRRKRKRKEGLYQSIEKASRVLFFDFGTAAEAAASELFCLLALSVFSNCRERAGERESI